MFLAGCQDDEMFTSAGDELVTLRYTANVDNGMRSRAIGDGTKVDQLLVGVFQDGKQVKQYTFDVKDGHADIHLPLLRNESYDLVFWAQTAGNGIYLTEDLSHITVDYSEFQKTQVEAITLDAFYATRTGVSVSNPGNSAIELVRPFTQMSFGVYGNEEIKGQIVSARVTVNGTLYTGFNPFADGEKAVAGEQDTYEFTFTALEDKTNTFIIDGKEFTHLTASYFFVPTTVQDAKISGSVSLMDAEGSTVSEFLFADAPLLLNTRVNIGKGLVEVWDGVNVEALPEADGDGIIHIENTQQLAFLVKYGLKGTYEQMAKVHLCKDLDMNLQQIERDGTYVLDSVVFDGGGHTIYRLGNALFRSAAHVEVTDLNINGSEMQKEEGHIGALIDTLRSNAIFTRVSIEKAKVTTANGAAGGMVGYIVRSSEKDRAETLSVSFNGCQVNNSTISASAAEGIFVGELSGYDNQETLSFDAECSAENTFITDYTSSYLAENQSVWLDDVDTNYDNWLGTETYRRGVVKFDEVQLVPKWDGKTMDIVPLVENNVNVIYSPYDVAYYQKKSSSTVTFKTDVDLGSNKFDPIKSITNLDGENHTVYNLKVDMVHDGTGAAFIQSASGTTTHKDIIFVGADIKNVHDEEIPVPDYGNEDDDGAGNAYAGTLVSHSGGTYNVSNVHVKSGKVYAVCKMGGLVGYVGGNLNMNDCSVNDYTIENYEPMVPNYYAIPGISFSSFIVNGLQWWYTNGECGGLIGFIKSPKAEIIRCSVTNSNINCVGQPNKEVIANVYNADGFDSSDPYRSGKGVYGTAKTEIAGRHVNQFIGDIVSEREEEGSNYIVNIEDYTVSGNKYFGIDASDTDNKYNHCYEQVNKGSSWKPNYEYSYCDAVGSAYYVGVDISIWFLITTIKKHIMYCAGELTFKPLGKESVTITEAVGDGNNIAWTGGSFKDLKVGGKSSYPTYP